MEVEDYSHCLFYSLVPWYKTCNNQLSRRSILSTRLALIRTLSVVNQRSTGSVFRVSGPVNRSLQGLRKGLWKVLGRTVWLSVIILILLVISVWWFVFGQWLLLVARSERQYRSRFMCDNVLGFWQIKWYCRHITQLVIFGYLSSTLESFTSIFLQHFEQCFLLIRSCMFTYQCLVDIDRNSKLISKEIRLQ